MQVILDFQNCSGCPFCKFDYDINQHYCGQRLEDLLQSGDHGFSKAYLDTFPDPAEWCAVKANPRIIACGQ